MKQIACLVFLGTLVIITAVGCSRKELDDETEYGALPLNGEGAEYGSLVVPRVAEIYENLALLGKVWGFVKYTHNSFISGQMYWDAELLGLIPLVLESGDVQSILYNWFVGLGDDGWVYLPPQGESLRLMSDMSWINYDRLGPLAEHLLRFNGVSNTDRSAAPVFFGSLDIPDFSNQNSRPNMDFGNAGERLLGLFRLWNAMNYFFPHLDVLDSSWNDLLLRFIPKMLEGSDRRCFELTLAGLAHYLHDINIHFFETRYLSTRFGGYIAPVQLIYAEGRIVVYDLPIIGVPFQRGDVILAVNGKDVDVLISEMKPLSFFPNDDKALSLFSGRFVGFIQPGHPHLLVSHERTMYIDVLRGNFGMSYRVHGQSSSVFFSPQNVSHALLENNIGLINPWVQANVHVVMESLASTEGIIIDLRQRPHHEFGPAMGQYLMETPLPCRILSMPSQNFPGKRFNALLSNHFLQSPYAFIYDRPVVILMDEQSFGYTETVIMSLRTASNVTVIGTYTMGATGVTARLPLPGRIMMSFTALGAYTPEGGQIHRVGLAPDIRVNRTIQGIADGRDEIMEAAIQFIIEN